MKKESLFQTHEGDRKIPEHEHSTELSPLASSLKRDVLKLPEGERVPDDAIQSESVRLERSIQSARHQSETGLRKHLARLFPKSLMQIGGHADLLSNIGERADVSSPDDHEPEGWSSEAEVNDVEVALLKDLEQLPPGLIRVNLEMLASGPLEDIAVNVDGMEGFETRTPTRLLYAFYFYRRLLVAILGVRDEVMDMVAGESTIRHCIAILAAEMKRLSPEDREAFEHLTEEYRHIVVESEK